MTPSSATRFNTPLEPMMAVFTAPARIRKPMTTTKAFNSNRAIKGPAMYIASPPIRLSAVGLHAHLVGDQHHRQEGNPGREHEAVDKDDESRLLEVLHFGRFHLAVDLGQRLFAAHRQDRMPEGDQQADHADDAHPVARLSQLRGQPGEPAGDCPQRVLLLFRDAVFQWLRDRLPFSSLAVFVLVVLVLGYEFAGRFVA